MADRAMNDSQRDQRAEPFEDDLPADPVCLSGGSVSNAARSLITNRRQPARSTMPTCPLTSEAQPAFSQPARSLTIERQFSCVEAFELLLWSAR